MFLFLTQITAATVPTLPVVIDRPCYEDYNGNVLCGPCPLGVEYGSYGCAPPIPPEPCANANNDYSKCKSPKIDVVFVIDSTGSMADEIRSVKYHIKQITQKVQLGYPQPKVRIGVVTYRDYPLEEDEYVTQESGLTTDVNDALLFVENIVANGGGDTPEAVEAGLDEALNMWWDNEARKIIFLIGDAPPHGVGSSDGSYQNGPPGWYTYKDYVKDAIEENIRIFTISGSGMDSIGVRIWKEIAYETNGVYYPLSYERVPVERHFREEQIDPVYMAEARAAPDYDYATDSIEVNNLGTVAEKAIMQEAQAAGVIYDAQPVVEVIPEEIVLPEVVEPEPRRTEPVAEKSWWDNFLAWVVFWK
ncbi:VWA domain-containing protein [Candidatus Woesearchaeota archaeon]|nr:VWA domain-containing protein [Candidatus Woesearchaeota archaeon]